MLVVVVLVLKVLLNNLYIHINKTVDKTVLSIYASHFLVVVLCWKLLYYTNRSCIILMVIVSYLITVTLNVSNCICCYIKLVAADYAGACNIDSCCTTLAALVLNSYLLYYANSCSITMVTIYYADSGVQMLQMNISKGVYVHRYVFLPVLQMETTAVTLCLPPLGDEAL